MLLEIMDGRVTEEGHYEGRAIVTGTGVLDYMGSHGVNMLRPEEEVFAPETMDSARMIAVTLSHPARNVDAETTRKHAIGWTGEKIERIGNKMALNFKIVDGWVVKQMQKLRAMGKRIQFSLGYKAKADRTPGVYQDKAYQVIQRRIRYNHLALLLDEEGRYPETDLLTDSKQDDDCFFLMDSQPLPKTQEVKTVKKKLPNGAEIEIGDADERYLDNHLTDFNNQKNELARVNGELTEANRQLERAKGQIMDSNAIEAQVQERLALVAEAKVFTDKADADLLKLTPQEIRESVLLADGYTEDELKDMRDKDNYDATLSGIYAQVIRSRGQKASQDIKDSAGKASATTRTDGGGKAPHTPPGMVDMKAKNRQKFDAACKGAKA